MVLWWLLVQCCNQFFGVCANQFGAPDDINVILITEIADPFNDGIDGSLQYVELFNLSKEPINLSSGFALSSFTNASAAPQVCSGLTTANGWHPREN